MQPNYYILADEHAPSGPFTAVQLVEMVKSGTICYATPAAQEGAPSWKPMSDLLPALEEAFTRAEQEVLESGPPTSPLLLNLLKEDGAFPKPRIPIRGRRRAG